MYTKTDPKVMGAHLKELAYEKYGSIRRFGKACLERKEKGASGDQVLVGYMETRLSQIMQGKKGMKLEDLEAFSELLNVSCEELLLGKKMEEPVMMNNFTVAKSTEEEVWEAYLKLPECPALYKDSYGRSLIDYAVEFKNLALLHYMLDHGYLHLAMDNKANTGIIGSPDMLNLDMKERNDNPYDFWMRTWEALPELRKAIIRLAIESGDLWLLDQMHARETPGLYNVCLNVNCRSMEEHCDPDVMEALAKADEAVLQYFSEKFEIEDGLGEKFRFVFPFLGELIEKLMEHRSDAAIRLLKKAKSHNQSVYSHLCNYRAHVEQVARETPGSSEDMVQRRIQEAMNDLQFDGEGRMVQYMHLLFKTRPSLDKYVSNIIRVHIVTEDPTASNLVRGTNGYWDKIHALVCK